MKMYFQPLKTLKFGVFETTEELVEALNKKGVNITSWARKLINQLNLKIIKKGTEFKLVVVSARELGFSDSEYINNGVKLPKIYKKAKKSGLTPCPTETGPLLRLVYEDQPEGERLYITTDEGIIIDGISPSSFHLSGHKYGLSLGGVFCHSETLINVDSPLVFVQK